MKSKKLMSIVIAATVCVSFLGMAKFSGNSIAKADTQTTQTVQASSSNNITRLGGTDRYDTSVKISQYGWKQADTVFIAGAEHDTDFADAIAGTPLAHSYDAPILLTRAAALPDNISAEITRLSPKNVYILGGTGVVSQDIEDGLKAKGYTVARIAGQDRYETAIEIAKQLWDKYPTTKEKLGSDAGVILTTGQQFQYAMSVAATAGKTAILFSDGDTINPKVANFIASDKNIQSVAVIGGNKVLGIKGDFYNSNPSLFHIDDANTIPELEKKEGYMDLYTGVAVASDTIFPDALSGSALAAKLGYKLILSDGTDLTYNFDLQSQNWLSGGLIFGGTGVIPDSLPGKISAIFNKNIPANPDGLKDTDVIPFTDENLKKDIEKYVGKTDITLADAKKINLLDLEQDSNKGGYQISDFKDIKYFPNLSAMIIRNGVFPTKNLDVFNSLYDFKGNFGGFSLVNCKYNDSDFNALNKDIVVIKNSK